MITATESPKNSEQWSRFQKKLDEIKLQLETAILRVCQTDKNLSNNSELLDLVTRVLGNASFKQFQTFLNQKLQECFKEELRKELSRSDRYFFNQNLSLNNELFRYNPHPVGFDLVSHCDTDITLFHVITYTFTNLGFAISEASYAFINEVQNVINISYTLLQNLERMDKHRLQPKDVQIVFKVDKGSQNHQLDTSASIPVNVSHVPLRQIKLKDQELVKMFSAMGLQDTTSAPVRRSSRIGKSPKRLKNNEAMKNMKSNLFSSCNPFKKSKHANSKIKPNVDGFLLEFQVVNIGCDFETISAPHEESSPILQPLNVEKVCQIYTNEMDKEMTSNSELLITTDMVDEWYRKAYSKVESQELNFHKNKLASYLLPVFKQFCSHVVKRNEQVILNDFSIQKFLGLNDFVFDLCISKLTQESDNISLYGRYITLTYNALEQKGVFNGHNDLHSWLVQALYPLQASLTILQTYLDNYASVYSGGTGLFYIMTEESYSMYASDLEENFTIDLPLSLEIEKKLLEGKTLIKNFFATLFSTLKECQMSGLYELAPHFVQFYHSFMLAAVDRHLLTKCQLNTMHSKIESGLLEVFLQCWKEIVAFSFAKFTSRLNYMGEQFQVNNRMNLETLTDAQANLIILTLRIQLKDRFLSIFERNKVNIQNMYKDSLKLVVKLTHEFELVVNTTEPNLEMHQNHMERAVERLAKDLKCLKFSVQPSNFITNFKKHCMLYSNTVLSRSLTNRHKMADNHTVLKNITKTNLEFELPKAVPQSFVINLNFYMIKVAINNRSREVYRVLPTFVITESGRICLGDSMNTIESSVRGTQSLKFNLNELLDPNSVYKTHKCFINGELINQVKPYVIFSQFLSQLKNNIEREQCIDSNSALIVVPLRFTMGQRWIVQQAAVMAGFSQQVKLVNDTSAVAYEAINKLKKLEKFQNLSCNQNIVTVVHSDGFIDSSLYFQENQNATSSSSVIQMKHSFCNIPQSENWSWLNLCSSKFDRLLIRAVAVLHQHKFSAERGIYVVALDDKLSKFLEIYDYSTSVMSGAYRLLRDLDNCAKPVCYLIRECIPYSIYCVVGKERKAVFPVNEQSGCENVILIDATKCRQAKFIECGRNGENHILCTLVVNSTNTFTKLKVTCFLDSDGCLDETFFVDYIGQLPDITNCWEEPKITNEALQNYVKNSSQINSHKAIIARIEVARGMIAVVEPEIEIINNSMKKRFLNAALQDLKDEISNHNCTEDSIETQYAKLHDLFKKFTGTK